MTISPSNVPLSEYNESWLAGFWRIPVLIHGIVEIILTILIFILEIASLAVSTYSATGAGIWCSISFVTTAILTILLVTKFNRSRVWATRVCIAQIVLLVFCLILIGIVGNYVSTHQTLVSLESIYSISTSTFTTKYKIMQAQLAFAILLLFAGIAYIVYYCVVTYLALWRPYHTLDTPHLFRE